MYWKLNTRFPPTIKHDHAQSNTPSHCLPAKNIWRLGCFLTLGLSARSSCSRKAFACFCCKNWRHPVSGGRDVPIRGWPWWQERTHRELDGRVLPERQMPSSNSSQRNGDKPFSAVTLQIPLLPYLFIWLHRVFLAAHRTFISSCRTFPCGAWTG